jgi:hypothetical protein
VIKGLRKTNGLTNKQESGILADSKFPAVLMNFAQTLQIMSQGAKKL